MYKHKMDPIRTVGATERTRMQDGGMDGQTDGWTEWYEYTPNIFDVSEYNDNGM